jgi:hypothetical protein
MRIQPQQDEGVETIKYHDAQARRKGGRYADRSRGLFHL